MKDDQTDTAQPRYWSMNGVVGWNIKQARQHRDLTQEEAAERLERVLKDRWSGPSWSVAENAYRGRRTRQFNADEIVALAVAFQLPIEYFFTPPPGVIPDPSRDRSRSITWREATRAIGGATLYASNVVKQRLARWMRGRKEFFEAQHECAHIEIDWGAPQEPKRDAVPEDPKRAADWLNDEIVDLVHDLRKAGDLDPEFVQLVQTELDHARQRIRVAAQLVEIARRAPHLRIKVRGQPDPDGLRAMGEKLIDIAREIMAEAANYSTVADLAVDVTEDDLPQR